MAEHSDTSSSSDWTVTESIISEDPRVAVAPSGRAYEAIDLLRSMDPFERSWVYAQAILEGLTAH